MDGIRRKLLLKASELLLSIAAGGLFAVNHRLEEFPIYVAAMYLLMTFGVLLLVLSVCHWEQGLVMASATASAYESGKKFSTLGKLLLCVATGGLLVVSTKPMDQFPNSAAAVILLFLMNVGFLLLWGSLVLPPAAEEEPASMAGIPPKQLLMASELLYSISAGGLLAVNHRLQECPIYAAAMYLVMNMGVLLLGLSMCRWRQGSATASATAFRHEFTKKLSISGKLFFCVATGGLLVVTKKPMDQFPYFVAAILLYLLMTIGFLLLCLSLILPPLGYAAAATGGDDS